ncbi:hypothetical protein I5Q34_26530 [Streptomyces sp. AV19]|uniref:hypothetical protein n=1 Tax=Streptomyces sp. AV19 TaxID=2793068 RepID=UPI0018FE89A4|nr:hypothetical protein [Streptomyces sp. AV19]MBH1937786.1 hypothetical protein [Streptomyces sp. AV19]MDG4537062.1 hypothetical protein [Streptomyces sp. AV19]
MTGEQLAESLLRGVDDEQTEAATRLLGAYRSGYWLRRLAEDQGLAMVSHFPLVNRSGNHPSVEWEAVQILLARSPALFRASDSELAILEIAVSLAADLPIRLGTALCAMDSTELELVLKALKDAGPGRLIPLPSAHA